MGPPGSCQGLCPVQTALPSSNWEAAHPDAVPGDLRCPPRARRSPAAFLSQPPLLRSSLPLASVQGEAACLAARVSPSPLSAQALPSRPPPGPAAGGALASTPLPSMNPVNPHHPCYAEPTSWARRGGPTTRWSWCCGSRAASGAPPSGKPPTTPTRPCRRAARRVPRCRAAVVGCACTGCGERRVPGQQQGTIY